MLGDNQSRSTKSVVSNGSPSRSPRRISGQSSKDFNVLKSSITARIHGASSQGSNYNSDTASRGESVSQGSKTIKVEVPIQSKTQGKETQSQHSGKKDIDHKYKPSDSLSENGIQHKRRKNGNSKQHAAVHNISEWYTKHFPPVKPEYPQLRTFTSLTPVPMDEDDISSHLVTASSNDTVSSEAMSPTETDSYFSLKTSEPNHMDLTLQCVKEGRRKRLKDKFTGVRKDLFLNKLLGEYAMYSENYDMTTLIRKDKPVCSRQNTFHKFDDSDQSVCDSNSTKSRSKSEKMIFKKFTYFTLPNQKYINGPTNISNVGVDWRFSPPPSPKTIFCSKTYEQPRSSSYGAKGKLCRSKYPVTEALHKEGTSVTKKKGKTMNTGDMNIYKVWPRKIDTESVMKMDPVLIAKQDGRLLLQAKGRQTVNN